MRTRERTATSPSRRSLAGLLAAAATLAVPVTAAIAMPADPDAELHATFDRWRASADLCDRLDAELVEAEDRYAADQKAADIANGLAAAEAASDEAHAANRELRRLIILAEATTLAGMLLKARVLTWCRGSVDDTAEHVAVALATDDMTDDTVLWSIGRDLAAMVGRGAAA